MNISRPINRIAEFLSTAVGFVTTFVVLLIGIGIGALVQFTHFGSQLAMGPLPWDECNAANWR